ncbi:ABC transporter permease [Egibacter rhizosphaerae]|uniref:ABC transporter permease n=2 Tax=Egibacter rhizosphaerae TaxID=1670831 RepID=A0A411YL97_9ACTN|nr:ABC transporter permease [Egibacter rhizosphaerae]
MRRQQRRLVRSPWRQPLALIGAGIVGTWLVLALLAPWITPFEPLAQTAERLAPPSIDHWFGTDRVGRDILTRVLYGARTSIPLALIIVAVAATIGSLVGAVAGYAGGVVDNVLMRLVDLFFAFPNIILAMAVTAALGPDLRNAVIAIVVVSWPVYARVVRGLVLSIREMDYFQASRLAGVAGPAALRRDVLPNVAGSVAVLATLEMGNAVLLLSALSFLGLGARPPAPEWGSMVAAGADSFAAWWVGMFPGLAIVTIVLAFNLLGDNLRDALDPRTSKGLGRRAL